MSAGGHEVQGEPQGAVTERHTELRERLAWKIKEDFLEEAEPKWCRKRGGRAVRWRVHD